MKKFLLFALCGLSYTDINAQLCLAPTTNYYTGGGPNNITLADFNNDSKLDMATADNGSVAILLGDGIGGFGSATTYTTANYAVGICSADFNGDNNTDIAITIAFGGSNKVGIFLGTGSGTFGTISTFTVPAGPNSICTADFNSDSKADLATANYNANSVSVMYGIGNGTFGSPNNVITMSSSPYQIITADFNGDNKPDLATVNETTSGNVSVYLNDGTGTIQMGSIYGSGTNPEGLCAGDFNGDNRTDIIMSCFGDGVVAFIPNTGGGVFGSQTTFTVGVSPVGVGSGDFDGDSKLDLAVTDYNGTPQLYIMLGDGAGNLATGTPYSVGTNPFRAVGADFDGNGKLDVACPNYNSANISVLLNKAPVSGINGNLSMCSGNGTSLSANPALTYSWSSGGIGQSEFVSPVTNTSYTVSATNGACTTTTIATVTVTATPTITITGNLNICSGDNTILTAGTAASYTWGANAGGVNTNTTSVSPTTSTTYTVDGSNGNCFASASAVVNVTATPTVVITTQLSGAPLAICSGQSIALTGNSASSYTWSSGGSIQTETVSPLSTTNYTLTEANGVCTGSAVATVTVTSTPTVNVTGAQNVCFGSNTTLTGSGGTNYTWMPSGVNTNTVSVSPTTPTMYTLTAGNPLLGGSGECTSLYTVYVNPVQPQIPNICMVSSDSMSINNIIYWDKTVFTNMDSFIVYREVSTGIYKRIGAVSKDSLSQFVDTARSVGPANGDPNIGYYHYKLQLRDTCGNYSAKSPYHTSVFFIDNHTGTFTWNTYDVEGQTTPVANFILRRDNANTNVYVVIGNVSGNTTTLNDPNYSTYQTIANWRVDATGFNCTPTARYGNNNTQSAIVKSKSNISNNRTTGIKKTESNFSVYPNPTSGNITLSFANSTTGKVNVKVVSVLGQEVYNEMFTQANEKLNVDLSKYESGIYLVQVTMNNTTTVKRIVKN